MSKRLRKVFATPLVFFLMVLAIQVEAGVSGKISGVVEDTQSGEAVVGATVQVAGLDLATTTDEDGEYFIINVPVGKYDITVSHVGFESIVQKGVRVLLDLTTPVDFSVRQVAVQLKREVVVRADRPVIQKDLTASRSIFTVDRLSTLPNTVSVQSVLSNYPGVVMGKNSEMHVRGGRAGQVSYYLDGFSVQDPFVANAGLRIMPGALEELSLTTGGFAAEYGEALSGVVSAVTREGGSQYKGAVKVYEAFQHPYDVTVGDWQNLQSNDNRSMSFNVSGPMPGMDSRKYNFFAAGEYLHNNTFLPHDKYVSRTGMVKMIMKPATGLKIKTNISYFDGWGDIYEHRDGNGRSYDFNLDGLPVYEKESYLVGVSGSYSFTERTVFTTSLSRFSTNTLIAPGHLLGLHWSEWPGYTVDEDGIYNGTIDDDNFLNNPDNSNPYHMTGFTTGDDYEPSYSWRESKYTSFNVGLLSQVSKANQIKAGVELRKYDVNRDFKQFYNTNPYGEMYSCQPLYASMYIQDQLEYDEFIFNLGLRFDYRNNDIAYNVTPGDTVATYKDADSKSNLAPRLGMSFPVSPKTVMHFNYGTYYQAPLYGQMYFNLDGDISTGLPILGNPDLDPEKTVTYELGLDHLVGEDLRVDITAFYKDIKDLVTMRSFGSVGTAGGIAVYDNGDYGSVQGFDVSMEKLKNGGNLSASLSYSYMTATGSGSTPEEPYYTYLNDTNQLAPVTEYPLDFDQRHTLTASAYYTVPADWSYKLFGVPVPGDWGLSAVAYYGSGLPYTKIDASGNQLGENNEGRLPSNYSVDMRFYKDFRFNGQGSFLRFFVEVDNVFDRHNILNVYARTGLPDYDNNRALAGLALDQQELDDLDELYDHDPQNFSPPRTVRTGLEFNF